MAEWPNSSGLMLVAILLQLMGGKVELQGGYLGDTWPMGGHHVEPCWVHDPLEGAVEALNCQGTPL